MKPHYVHFIILPILILPIVISSSCATPPENTETIVHEAEQTEVISPEPEKPEPVVLPEDPITLSIHQRREQAIPGTDGSIKVRLGDITGGQAMFSVTKDGREFLVEPRSVHADDVIEVQLDDDVLFIKVVRLRNFLFGDDFGEVVVSKSRLEPGISSVQDNQDDTPGALAADPIEDAMSQGPPAIDISTGREIPSEGYCDQPFVVKLHDGTWLCTMTTGKGHEGQSGQHIVSCRTTDRGKTWGALIDIEPADGPEASWVMPFLTEYGRVYVFYTYNADNMREVIADGAYAKKRVDTLGEYALKYSDDGGLTWSPQRWFIPVREGNIDRRNPYQGKVRFFWGVGKPIRHEGAMYLGFSKVGKLGKGFIETSESWFLRCANIDTERDPVKLVWETLPDGDDGLESPEGPIAEEVNLCALSDGGLFCTYRTVAGHPCHAYSRDSGMSWTDPAFMTYGPGGKLVDHPRGANFVRKLTEGPYTGRFIYWFHNHAGKGYEGRNPAYLLGGVESDGPDGRVIEWGDPVAVLYDKNPKIRISYPDFIWDESLYITETQKTIARIHRIPDALLRILWDDNSGEQAAGGDAVDRAP